MAVLTGPVCIVDGHHGVYVPQVWAERYGAAAVEAGNVRAVDVEHLLGGPDAPDYWDVWDWVLSDYCHEVEGVKHYLAQDQDLFEYPETYTWQEDWED